MMMMMMMIIIIILSVRNASCALCDEISLSLFLTPTCKRSNRCAQAKLAIAVQLCAKISDQARRLRLLCIGILVTAEHGNIYGKGNYNFRRNNEDDDDDDYGSNNNIAQ